MLELVFTQFILVGRIVGRTLQDEEIGFLYYFGSMSHAKKRKAVKDFAEDNNIHVIFDIGCFDAMQRAGLESHLRKQSLYH
jgi:hypothetical protein